MKNKRFKKVLRVAALVLTALVLVSLVIAIVLKISDKNGDRPYAQLHNGDFGIYAMNYSEQLIDISISSPQGFLYDVSNDTIIYSKGHEHVVYPGSTTKLLTALFALEILPPYATVVPGDELELVKDGSSIAYIKSHHVLTVETLVQGMLIPSGNDAAYVLAAAAGKQISSDESISGKEAVDLFMTELREYASEIGLCGTSFTVPDGFDGAEHYTTTEDMIIISYLAYQNETIRKYAAMPKASVTYESGHTNEWINTNKLIDEESKFYSRYVTGLKTGTVDGECSLVFAFKFDDGREYIAGVFGSSDKNARFRDALNIIEKLK